MIASCNTKNPQLYPSLSDCLAVWAVLILMMTITPLVAGDILDSLVMVEDLIVNESDIGGKEPTIEISNAGTSLILWENGWDIYAQRMDADGNWLGSNFIIDTDSTAGGRPMMAMNNSGTTMVAWGGSDQDAVYLQALDSTGSKIGAGSVITIDSGPMHYTWLQNVLIEEAADDSFLVIWFTSPDGWLFSHSRRMVAPDGTILDLELPSIRMTGYMGRPVIAQMSSESYMLVWQEYDEDKRLYFVVGQQFAIAGGELSSRFLIDGVSHVADQKAPAVATLADGKYVVTWVDYRNGNPDIYGQLFDGPTSRFGASFLVNNPLPKSDHAKPAITALPDGGFIVLWLDSRTTPAAIFAKRFDTEGRPVSGSTRINTRDYDTIEQIMSRNWNNRLYTVWQGMEAPVSGLDIYINVVYYDAFPLKGETTTRPAPEQFHLFQNYPNPFNTATIIPVDISRLGPVSLRIYDLAGKEIVRLLDGTREPSSYEILWNGIDQAGHAVPSGVYVARLVTDDYTKSIKMTLVK